MTKRIVRDFQPLRIILFGSHARGDVSPDRDIDFLVVLPHVIDKRAEWAVKARYPGDWPEVVKEDARVAMTQARALWTAIRADFAQRGFEK
jgi:predicted nucleotidyltransferase